ncbi:MAG: phosphoglycerate dehydrogenase, partial [Deltaproteobacteria bacterium]
GVNGVLGSTLGAAGVNINQMLVGRETEQGRNVILLSTDVLVSNELLQQVRELPEIKAAMVLDLP